MNSTCPHQEHFANLQGLARQRSSTSECDQAFDRRAMMPARVRKQPAARMHGRRLEIRLLNGQHLADGAASIRRSRALHASHRTERRGHSLLQLVQALEEMALALAATAKETDLHLSDQKCDCGVQMLRLTTRHQVETNSLQSKCLHQQNCPPPFSHRQNRKTYIRRLLRIGPDSQCSQITHHQPDG